LVRSSPIKQRLICAYRRHLATLAEEQLPTEARDQFRRVLRCLRGVQPLRGEDTVAASVRKMSTQDADDCAALIVEIFGVMTRSRAELALATGGTVVQLHSVDTDNAEYEMPVMVAHS